MKRALYIFDLDGTLADGTHRNVFIEKIDPPNWRMYYAQCGSDTPIKPTIGLMRLLQRTGAEVWIVTGRSDEVRRETQSWLIHHTSFYAYEDDDKLIMRPAGEQKPDVEWKQEILDNMLVNDRERLVAVFEDRTRVVKMWRANGIQCYQVAEGDF